MDTIDEIRQLEERLRQAELGPDPRFFGEYLADTAVVDGQQLKTRIVEAHRPRSGKGQKFTKVELSDFAFVDHGHVLIVTCQGLFEGPNGSQTLKFMRAWLKEGDRWSIVAASTLA
jgi:hypothetical protein